MEPVDPTSEMTLGSAQALSASLDAYSGTCTRPGHAENPAAEDEPSAAEATTGPGRDLVSTRDRLPVLVLVLWRRTLESVPARAGIRRRNGSMGEAGKGAC